MDPELLELLNLLGGASLRELRYDASNPQLRTVHLLVRCDAAMPRDPLGWADRLVHVRALRVVLFRCDASLPAPGYDQVERWDPDVRPETRARLEALERDGRRVPATRCTLRLAGGSRVELACEQITAEIAS
jgi:hypothetical protein